MKKAEFPDGYNTVSGIAPAGGSAGRHIHPGVEMGYPLEGEADLIVEGRPDQHLKAGDSYTIPAGTVHDAKVHGDKPVKVLGDYVVDRQAAGLAGALEKNHLASGTPVRARSGAGERIILIAGLVLRELE